MNKKLKVGVAGCGQIAQIAHLPYLRELPMFELAALCDLSPHVVDTLGEIYQVKNRYVDAAEMARQADLDVVLVTNKNHAGPALLAMEAGKHVLVEKPMAFNLAQADEMIASAARNHVKLMVGYMKRYDPGFEVAKQSVDAMDKVHVIRVHDFAGTYKINNEIYDLVTPTDLNREQLSGLIAQDQQDMLADIGPGRSDLLEAHDIMIHLCIHDINVLHGMYGLPHKIHKAQLFDGTFVTALMEYENGVRCMWETGNLVDLVDWDEHIQVWGPQRRVELKFPFPYLKNAASTVHIDENQGAAAVRRSIVASYDEAFKREWRHFYHCISADRAPHTGPAEAREDLAFGVELMKAAIA
ncbi:MAG: Gfo/Idh/MocA family oxidoreductase [Chloroflexi bacterium]|nr:Gfo/Idh/MocA family oxidoreductase [Chloroflexota bacterium]